MRENRARYVVEAAPFELLVETLQKSCGDLARQWMIFAEDARRSPVSRATETDGETNILSRAPPARQIHPWGSPMVIRGEELPVRR